MKNSLYYISSICWPEVSKDAIINSKALQKNDYIEAPKNLSKDETIKFISRKLYESSNVHPWYYNIDVIC